MVLRGIAIDHTPALTDEAFTFWRICGSLGQLMDTLRLDAFPPLHYLIVWALAKLLGPDVWVLRLPAAIAGVLMPIAVGRLARVLFGRRAVVPAALLTLSSAYFAYFSRNAKMYMPGWLLMTLATAAILAFARTRRTRDLSAFVIFGAIGGMMMSLVLLPLAAAPLLAVAWAKGRRLRVALSSVVATAAVFAGPATYYLTYNRWFVESGGFSHTHDDRPAEHNNGLGWIGRWQSDRSPANLTLQSFSSYLVNVEWPPENEVPRTWKYNTLADKVFLLNAASVAWAGLIGGVAFAVAAMRRGSADRCRRAFVLLVLLPLPLYVLYLRSYHTLAAPWQLGWPVDVAATLAVLPLLRPTTKSRFTLRHVKTALIWFGLALATSTVAWIIARIAYAHAPVIAGRTVWNTLWMPRYAALIAPALLATLGGAVATLRRRWAQAILLAPLLVANLIMTLLPQCLATQIPWSRICSDLAASRSSGASSLAADWLSNERGLGMLPAPYYELARAARVRVDPLTFRDGNDWPYRPGPAIKTFFDELPLGDVDAVFRPGNADRAVIWLRDSGPPVLPPGWKADTDETITVYSIANWNEVDSYRRIAYRRSASESQP